MPGQPRRCMGIGEQGVHPSTVRVSSSAEKFGSRCGPAGHVSRWTAASSGHRRGHDARSIRTSAGRIQRSLVGQVVAVGSIAVDQNTRGPAMSFCVMSKTHLTHDPSGHTRHVHQSFTMTGCSVSATHNLTDSGSASCSPPDRPSLSGCPAAKSLMVAGWSPTAAGGPVRRRSRRPVLVATLIKPDWLRQARDHARIVVVYGLIPAAGAQLCYYNAVAHLGRRGLVSEYTCRCWSSRVYGPRPGDARVDSPWPEWRWRSSASRWSSTSRAAPASMPSGLPGDWACRDLRGSAIS